MTMTIGNKRNSLPGFHPRRRIPLQSWCKRIGNLKLLVVFLLGILVGRLQRSHHTAANSDARSATTELVTSLILDLQDLPVRNTSHVNPETGIAITKQQLLEPFVVPRQTGFSVATILAGETVQLHSHRNMHEFFYVLEGSAIFWMCTQGSKPATSRMVQEGTFAHFVPHCDHGISVPANSTTGLKVLVSGVTVGE